MTNKKYRVRYEWQPEGGWYVNNLDVPGAHSQGKDLRQSKRYIEQCRELMEEGEFEPLAKLIPSYVVSDEVAAAVGLLARSGICASDFERLIEADPAYTWKTYLFELQLAESSDAERMDELAGLLLSVDCDDTVLGSFDDKVSLSFAREAPSKEEAIASALNDLAEVKIRVIGHPVDIED